MNSSLEAARTAIAALHSCIESGESCDARLHHAYLEGINEIDAARTAHSGGCACGRREPVAGICFDIDGAWWNGHGPEARAAGLREDAGYLADAAVHVADHMAQAKFACEDAGNLRHFAGRVRAALTPSPTAPEGDDA